MTRPLPHIAMAVRRQAKFTSGLAVFAAMLAIDGWRRGAIPATLVYFSAIGASVAATEFLLRRHPIDGQTVIVKSPGIEMMVAGAAGVLAYLWLWSLFVGHTRPASPVLRLVFVVFGLGSVFSLTLAAFLAARGYHLLEFGIRWRGVSLAPVGVVDIIPLGLLFGYITQRTGSWVPAAIVHAANIWGLQNL